MMEFQMTTDLQTAVPAEIGFNFDELKAELANRLEYYRGIVVTEDTIKESKADRATLNKLRTAIDTRRKDVKKAYLRPYNEFEAKCKELTVLIDEPIRAIDLQLATFEEQRKEEKLRDCINEYENTISDTFKSIIPFDRIMDKRWMNATTTMTQVKEDLREWNKRVGADMLALDAIEDEYKLAVRQKYAETLDVAKAIAHRDSLKAAEDAFRAREEAKKAAEIQMPTEPEKTAPAPEIAPTEATHQQTEPRLYNLRLEFNLTREQAIALRRFLDENAINYQKLA